MWSKNGSNCQIDHTKEYNTANLLYQMVDEMYACLAQSNLLQDNQRTITYLLHYEISGRTF